MTTIPVEQFARVIAFVLDETFDQVHGVYLDRGTSLFETLAGVTAEMASVPVGGQCATLAAQVKHVAFYLDVVGQSMRDPNSPPADWGEIWRTVGSVTQDEWDAIQTELRASYDRILDQIRQTTEWPDARALGDPIGVIAHTAYHLGEIRQALCMLN